MNSKFNKSCKKVLFNVKPNALRHVNVNLIKKFYSSSVVKFYLWIINTVNSFHMVEREGWWKARTHTALPILRVLEPRITLAAEGAHCILTNTMTSTGIFIQRTLVHI